MLLPWLADRLVLAPSRHRLCPYGKARCLVPWQGGQIEVWQERTAGLAGDANEEPDCFVLKLLGKAGRGERATLDPLDHWSDLAGEIWAVNPPGYGSSSGRASLRSLVPAAERVFDHLVRVADGRPIFVVGESLGTMPALYLAARHARRRAIAGLILRNPGPLDRLIAQHYSRCSLGLSHILALAVPRSLDAVSNAAAAYMPAIMLTAGHDKVIPPRFQQLVANVYAGPLQRLVLPQAEHAIRMTRRDRLAYGRALDWLREQALPSFASERTGSLLVAGE
jgi:pimeloyl-ACP methyl ester carboxylesterase